MRSLPHYSNLFAEFRSALNGPSTNLLTVAAIGKKLKLEGFKPESDQCLEVCLRAMNHFIATKDIEKCLFLEGLIYQNFIKTTETEEHYHKIFNRFSTQLQNLGRERARPFAPRREANSMCFVLHAGVILGHTEVMLETISGFSKAGIECKVFCAVLGNNVDPALINQLNALGVGLLQAGGQETGLMGALDSLRDQLEHFRINTVVWVSIPITASYALALRLAPRQIFWSLKLHPFSIPEVDVHICVGHESETARVFHDHEWTVAPFPLTNACRPNSPEKVAEFKLRFPPSTVLIGSLAREEKFEYRPFIMAVCAILDANPNAHYLWTGRSQPPSVLDAFEEFGVKSRCHFLGWVDTNLVAEALDLFLETFPFGCGVTGYQAMGHGTPVLSMRAPDTLYGSFLRAYVERNGQAASKDGLETADILTALNIAHYIELGNKLVRDGEFRSKIGKIERQYFVRERDALPRIAERLWKTIMGH